MRKIALGNGTLLVLSDDLGQIKDLYYPYIGLHNHVDPKGQRMGVFVDGKFSWLNHDTWKIRTEYKRDTMVSDTAAVNESMGVYLRFQDAVHPKKDIFLRHITVKNLSDITKEFRLFFSSSFRIYGNVNGNTVFFEPSSNAVIFYNKNRYFLISGMNENRGFDDYATGIYNFNGLKGTYVDAEDGSLSKNPIEHGSVDAVIGFTLLLGAKRTRYVDLWIAAGEKFMEVSALHNFVIRKKPVILIKDAENAWNVWVSKKKINFFDLDEGAIDLFRKSLLIIRTHIDNCGAIIASCDSEMLKFNRDAYNYMWPRDAAFTAIALDKAGYKTLTRRFFLFIKDIITNGGYLLSKYNADKSAGSSWHPWIKHGTIRLPIQEDEISIIIHALWNHYETTKNVRFVKDMYKDCVKPISDFMVRYRDHETKLPKESYDIWEEKFGVHTYTCASVYGGLMAASKLASLIRKRKDKIKYAKAAEEVKKAVMRDLYDKDAGRFLKRTHFKEGRIVRYADIDISTLYGLHNFGLLDSETDTINSIKFIEDNLMCRTVTGGCARYIGDDYWKIKEDINIPGNPWIICTLWLANLYIAKAATKNDMKMPKKIIRWVVDHASNTGMLSEQLNPYTGGHLSVSPLIWSHAAFIDTIFRYIEKSKKIHKHYKL